MFGEGSAKKVLVLGIDGLDPRLTRRFVNEGRMPNTKKFLEKGSAREDLVLLCYANDYTANVDDIGYRGFSNDTWDYLLLEKLSWKNRCYHL